MLTPVLSGIIKKKKILSLPGVKGPRGFDPSDLLSSSLSRFQCTVGTFWITWFPLSQCSLSPRPASTVGRECLIHAALLLVGSSCRENSLSLISNHVLRCLSCNPSPPSNKHLSAPSLAYVHRHFFWAFFCSIVKRLQKSQLSFLFGWKKKLSVRSLLLN